MRRLAACAVFPAFLAAGCLQAGMNQGLSRVFSLGSTADPPSREPSLAAAARVDQVGRQLAAANTFTAGDIGFQTVGADDPAVFHRDAHCVFITDSLVHKCKSDGELAAVLCTEIGRMVAEKRNAARMGVPEPIPDLPTVPNSSEAGGIPADQVRLAELGMLEKKFHRTTTGRPSADLTDPRKLAADLLKTAGYDEAELDRADPLLKATSADSPVVRQLAGPAAAPRWSR